MKLSIPCIAAVLAILTASPVWADAGAGQQTFGSAGCDSCHYAEGPAREKTIDDQLAKKGPELWYAGSKFQSAWLEQWLQAPTPIRQVKYNTMDEPNPGDHPALAAADAGNVRDYLMSQTSDAVVAGKIKPKKNPKGRLIFRKKMPCNGCHQYVDRNSLLGGKSGPSLVGAAERLNPDWVFAYLKDPTVFKPVRAMPVFSGLMGERDMESVSAYVATFATP